MCIPVDFYDELGGFGGKVDDVGGDDRLTGELLVFEAVGAEGSQSFCSAGVGLARIDRARSLSFGSRRKVASPSPKPSPLGGRAF